MDGYQDGTYIYLYVNIYTSTSMRLSKQQVMSQQHNGGKNIQIQVRSIKTSNIKHKNMEKV